MQLTTGQRRCGGPMARRHAGLAAAAAGGGEASGVRDRYQALLPFEMQLPI
jgi:hypothetical protein